MAPEDKHTKLVFVSTLFSKILIFIWPTNCNMTSHPSSIPTVLTVLIVTTFLFQINIIILNSLTLLCMNEYKCTKQSLTLPLHYLQLGNSF